MLVEGRSFRWLELGIFALILAIFGWWVLVSRRGACCAAARGVAPRPRAAGPRPQRRRLLAARPHARRPPTPFPLAPRSFCYEMALAKPVWGDVFAGFVPTPRIFTDPGMLTIAIGILGATVMPHNLYLHSAVIQTRAYERTSVGRRRAIMYGTLDSTLSLAFALLVNAAILILAAAAFYYSSDPHRWA